MQGAEAAGPGQARAVALHCIAVIGVLLARAPWRALFAAAAPSDGEDSDGAEVGAATAPALHTSQNRSAAGAAPDVTCCALSCTRRSLLVPAPWSCGAPDAAPVARPSLV